MTKAFIYIPPIEVEAGQRECPESCPMWRFTFQGVRCFAYDEKLARKPDSGVDGGQYFRCPACHDKERPAEEVVEQTMLF